MQWDETYPVRCAIVDADGIVIFPGVTAKTPEQSRGHVGKFGKADRESSGSVRITLDDGSVIMGHECWWVPVLSEEG